MPELLVFQKNNKVFHLPLDSDRVLIGRSSKNDLILSGDMVSRRHIILEKENGQFWLKDCSSTGTTFNGKPVTDRVALKNKSEIGISDWSLVFSDEMGIPLDHQEERQTQISQLRAKLHVDHTRVLQFDMSEIVRVLKPMLIIWDAKTGQRNLSVKKPRIIIGTASDCDVVLKDEFVSKYHVELTQSDFGFHLRDLDSTNGTFIKSAKIKESYIKEDEEIEIGKSKVIITFSKEYEKELTPFSQDCFCGMYGASREMRFLFKKIQKVSETDMTVLVQGETGTGKEMVVKAIHDLSSRRDKPFVVLNCGAISANLIESELFGHEKGAFTGADQKRMGAFEQANHGTLFLDEIGELPLDLQSKVLRVLEYQTLKKVGGSSEIKVDVRIIAATHRNLHAMVNQSKFREDLFYRLYILPLKVPSLRERKQDIEVLVKKFIKMCSHRKNISISEEAIKKLVNHIWPGNVRELKNTIMRALAFTDGQIINPKDIEIIGFASANKKQKQSDTKVFDDKRVFEKERILKAIKLACGDKDLAAKNLGMGRSTLFRKIKELEIDLEEC